MKDYRSRHEVEPEEFALHRDRMPARGRSFIEAQTGDRADEHERPPSQLGGG